MTFLGRKLNGQLPGRSRHRPARLLPAPAAPARPAREAPHEAQLDHDVRQGRLGAAGRDRHRSARRVSHPQTRAPPGKARHGVGADEEGRRSSCPRYRQICAQINARYLDALAHVDDPTPAIRALDRLTARASSPNGSGPPLRNPLSRHDRMLFETLLSGEHSAPWLHQSRPASQARAHLHSPRSRRAQAIGSGDSPLPPPSRPRLDCQDSPPRRWRVSLSGRRVMAAALKLREVAYPSLYADTA